MYPVSQYVGALVTILFVPVVVLVVATVRGQRARRRGGDRLEVWIRTWLVGVVALGATVIAVTFAVIPQTMADNMGYRLSPFQFEVLGTNLAFAVLAVIATVRPAHRLVVAVGYAIFMWWAMIGHLYQAVAHANLTPGNVPSIVVYDAAVPLVLLILVLRQRRLVRAD